MKDRFSLSIYRCVADYVVVPQSGGGGLYFAVEPIERVAADLDGLAKAIERVVAVSDVSLGNIDLRDYKSPISKALGLRSNKQFERSVIAMCSAHGHGAGIEITLERRARDGRGFEATERTVKLARGATAQAIAGSVMDLLNGAEAR